MKLDPRDPPRVFRAGAGTTVHIRDCGKLHLEPDEQITLVTEDGAEYDVARKAWGFYATPSLNGRLPAHGLRGALVRNEQGRFYVFLLEKGREDAFDWYLRDERQTLVAWLDDPEHLARIERTMGATASRRVPSGTRIEPDAWLADVMGEQVFRVAPDTKDPAAAAAEVAHHARAAARGPAFYYAKVATDDVRTVRALTGAGMYPADVNVTLVWDARAPARPAGKRAAGSDVHALRPGEADAVVAIAGRAFRQSRFHLDPAVPTELAHRVKGEWIANYARGARGDRLFVATEQGRPVGFLAALTTKVAGEAAAVIDLIAVDEGAQGRGHGRALVDAFVAHYLRTHPRLRVGTQAANVGSLALYQGAGFVVAETQYVLHLHVGSPEP